MVKLGFIAEGDTEKIILESDNFKTFLNELKIDFVSEVVNAKGNGNLLPHNIEKYSQVLLDKGATKIIILTDLDEDVCITKTKERIKPLENHIVIVSIKQIESWFLADTEAVRSFLNDHTFIDNDPETHNLPFDEVKRIRMELNGRGVSDKKIFSQING